MLSQNDIRHLTVRTAYGADLTVFAQLRGLNRSDAIGYLLNNGHHRSNAPKLTPLSTLSQKTKNATNEERKAIRKQIVNEANSLKQWWWVEIVKSKDPLRERLALFWHNHFTSSFRKVRCPDLLLRQNRLFSKYALGNFHDLLHEITQDAAMLIYLDGHKNKKGKPNENFARELLELFTLGQGNFSERDVKGAATAFTGWGVNRRTGKFRYSAKHHENQIISFLGQNIPSDGKLVVEHILRNPRTSEYIAEKVWNEFVSHESPDPDLMQKWGYKFRNSGYSIYVLVETVLHSDEFWDSRHRGALIKSPVDLLAGAFRELQIPVSDGGEWLRRRSMQLGQDLVDPPNVKGWAGGNSWITSQSLPLRERFVRRLVRGEEKNRREVMSAMNTTTSDSALRWDAQVTLEIMESWLLPLPSVYSVQATDHWRLLAQLVTDPAYQLR